MIRHPEGAVKFIYNLKKAATPGTAFYMIFNGTTGQFKFIVNEDFKIEENDKERLWQFIVDVTNIKTNENYTGHTFWSPYGALHFPSAPNSHGFLFDNYWHAYAYTLKLKKAV